MIVTNGFRGYLFRGQFSSRVSDEAHFFRGEFIGIESGACRHHEKGLVYPWSSASFHVRAEQDRPAGEGSKLGSVERFPRGASEVRNEMIRMTHKGRPIGGAGFVSIVERLTAGDL